MVTRVRGRKWSRGHVSLCTSFICDRDRLTCLSQGEVEHTPVNSGFRSSEERRIKKVDEEEKVPHEAGYRGGRDSVRLWTAAPVDAEYGTPFLDGYPKFAEANLDALPMTRLQLPGKIAESGIRDPWEHWGVSAADGVSDQVWDQGLIEGFIYPQPPSHPHLPSFPPPLSPSSSSTIVFQGYVLAVDDDDQARLTSLTTPAIREYDAKLLLASLPFICPRRGLSLR
ncbi:hypothetical protein NMY22_g4133 [Coprinellus aureogranulatus]|nr:hypothetical protein NMY22_g4133 [Coprinellus aureogranulatus]